MRGIRVVGAVENTALDESGTLTLPDPPVPRIVPRTYPALSGKYQSSAQHPRVFMTRIELEDVVKRINTPGTFSAQTYAKLASQVKKDLTGNTDWDAAYSGCDGEIYTRGFAYEPKPDYGNDRSKAQLDAAMHVRPGALAPHGAAVVASRMALYALLTKAGATTPLDAPAADQAAIRAKRILLAWADRGFRDEKGKFRSLYCLLDPTGKVLEPLGSPASALTHSRGVIYSIHAQDLLQSLHLFSPEEEARLNTFHRDMYDWIRATHNDEVKRSLQSRHPDEVYSNQTASHLTALLAAARLLDDRTRFNSVLEGGQASTLVVLPWVKLFDVIYGPTDRPFLAITPNVNDDPLSPMNRAAYIYTTKLVAAGEINDRFRHLNPLQSIGYSMATLEYFVNAAEILRNAGFDPYGYRGAHQQSIEMAVQYYACYGRSAGFYGTITAANSQSCPDYQQYIGRIVNGVEPMVIMGAYRFPTNQALTELDSSAKKIAYGLDTTLFGKWRD